MLTERFDSLLRSLSDAFVSYHDTPRSAETVVLLAGARARLDDARRAIWLERRRILQRVSPPGPRADSSTQVSPVFPLDRER